MRARTKIYIAVMLCAVTFCASCSRRGVYMPRSRKARHCHTCPTFSELQGSQSVGQTVSFQ